MRDVYFMSINNPNRFNAWFVKGKPSNIRRLSITATRLIKNDNYCRNVGLLATHEKHSAGCYGIPKMW
jgi:hypothetical protein